jgi:hypothetical protein
MTMPTPDDLGRAPLWENYVVAQAVQASLALIPTHAIAVGVAVAESAVAMRFQLTQLTEADRLDMDEILDDLDNLLGGVVHVQSEHAIVRARAIAPDDGVCWIYLARS